MIIERLNENAYISYPFLEDSIFIGSGGQEIPNSLFLDMKIDITDDPELKPNFVLMSVTTYAGYVTATFNLLHDVSPVGTTQLILPLLPDGTDSYVASFNVGAVKGIYTSGRGVNELIDNYPLSTIPLDKIALEPSCVTNTYKHQVNSIVGDIGGTLTGDVKIVEGHNISVSVREVSNTIRIYATPGAGEGMPCSQGEEDDGDCGSSLYRINGLKPDWFGNFSLQGGPGVSVEPDPGNHKIVIAAKVSGCDEGCVNDG